MPRPPGRQRGLLPGLIVGVVAVAAAAGWGIARLYTAPEGPSTDQGLSQILAPAVAALLAALLTGLLGQVLLQRDLTRFGKAIRHWVSGDLTTDPTLPHSYPLRRAGEEIRTAAGRLRQREAGNLREIDDQVLQADRLATTGRLAAGVAHEINNPLGGILLCGDLLLESTAKDDPRRENMERIVQEATRARAIVRGLLDFSRSNPPATTQIDLNQVLREVLHLLERQPLYQRTHVQLEICPLPLWIQADRTQIQQALINVVMNSLEAMRPGDTLTVRSGFSEREGFCRIAITDTGSGIPPDLLPRLFEPFFTTKEVGRGTGLGLAITHGIVRQQTGTTGQRGRFASRWHFLFCQQRRRDCHPRSRRLET